MGPDGARKGLQYNFVTALGPAKLDDEYGLTRSPRARLEDRKPGKKMLELKKVFSSGRA